METITLKAEPRTMVGKRNAALRNSGKIPAVLYGFSQKESQNLEVDGREFAKVFKKAGESTIVSLDVSGKSVPVLVHDVQNHYLKDTPIHIDFYAVNMSEKLIAGVPIHFMGEAPAVKGLGGMLVKNLAEVEVECLPADLPHAIEISIDRLATFEDLIRVSDLQVSDKVKIITGADEVVATVAPPRTEAEMDSLNEKPVEADVTKVEGVADKPEAAAEGEAAPDAKKE